MVNVAHYLSIAVLENMEDVVNSFLAFIFHHYLASQHDQQFLSKLVMRKLSSETGKGFMLSPFPNKIKVVIITSFNFNSTMLLSYEKS